MRNLLKAAIVLAALPMPASLPAQSAQPDSVDDYLCVFAGKCGDEAAGAQEVVKMAAPEVKGFCLGCPDKKGGTTAKPAAAPARKPVVVAAPVNRPTQIASNTRPGAASSAQQARADLRLTFNYNSDTLTAEAEGKAKRFAEALKRPELASKRFLIEGHTDSSGSSSYNLELSQRRADSVANYLVSQGVPRDRLETRGFGSQQPIGSSAAAPENRRVEAVLIS